MATVREYVEAKLARFSLALSPVEVDVLLTTQAYDDSTQCDLTTLDGAKRILVAATSELLAMPDITEGGFSQKFDRAAVQAYCEQLRVELGQGTATQPIIQDRSSLW